MAESADRRNPTERYGAIEQAYCADQWGEVIDQGQSLLEEIPRSSAPGPEGLKERVQLLMAHAHLYGFNERAAAEDLYSDVLHSKAELALRQIAEQGLQQCSLPNQTTTALSKAGELQASASESQHQAPAATADSERAAVPESEPALAPASTEPAAPWPAASVSSATTAPTATAPTTMAPTATAPAASSSLAMPWLVAGTATSSAATAAPSSAAPTPWTTVATPLAPPATTRPPQPGDAASEASAPAAAEPTPLIPEVVDEPELVEVHQADPSLAEELELTELEPPAPLALIDDDITASTTTLSAINPIASPERLQAQGESGSPSHSDAFPLLDWQEPRNINPNLTSERRQPNLEPEAPHQPQDLAQDLEPRTQPAPELEEEQDPLSELFSDPPTPREEEDRELFMGLLRVVVSAGSAGDGG
jgi:hypothetical protein